LTNLKELLHLIKINIMQGFEKLTNSLLAAKQVMNKVETGTYEKGSVDPTILMGGQQQSTPEPQQSQPRASVQRPVGANINEDKIKNSNLPENIKQLMIENPIPTVDFGNDLPSGFIDEVAKKMEEQSQFGAGGQRVKEPTPVRQPQSTQQPLTLNEDLKNFIKETIVETLGEIVDSKLDKLMETNKQIDENLQIRVGDSMFIGKITDVRKAK